MSESKTHKKRDIFVEGAIAPAFVAESIAKHATQTSIGGHEIFLGQVRADPVMVSPSYHDTSVVAIAYTAYRDMANERMTAIREEAFARWPITCLHVHHSLGTIAVGELCFFVFASAAHRQPARGLLQPRHRTEIRGGELKPCRKEFDHGTQSSSRTRQR